MSSKRQPKQVPTQIRAKLPMNSWNDRAKPYKRELVIYWELHSIAGGLCTVFKFSLQPATLGSLNMSLKKPLKMCLLVLYIPALTTLKWEKPGKELRFCGIESGQTGLEMINSRQV